MGLPPERLVGASRLAGTEMTSTNDADRAYTPGGPMPKVNEILGQLTGTSGDELITGWRAERIGQWWDSDGERVSPTGEKLMITT